MRKSIVIVVIMTIVLSPAFFLAKTSAQEVSQIKNEQQVAPKARKPKMTTDKMVNILNENYGFAKNELKKHIENGKDYREMNNICLYAYLSHKPLAEVVQMRDVYTWERLKLALGLTPQKFYNRKIEWQADRLWNKMGIERSTTIKYMKQGFPMHHINMAALLAPKVPHKDIKTIMLMKTPKNTWNDVALALGLTVADCQAIKDKITQEFKR